MLLVASATALTATAQTSAFTYQGQLRDGGTAATGTYDLRFALYDALSGGILQAGVQTLPGVQVTSGLFTATLDFGNGAFTGADRWIEIGVRTNGSSAAFTTLTPRTRLTSAPYALRAASAAVSFGAVGDNQLSPNVARLNADAQVFTGLNTFPQLRVGAVDGGFPLTVRGVDDYNDLLMFQDTGGVPRWHLSAVGNGLNFAESAVADYRLYLKPGGNVGIGTDAPGSRLEVVGGLRVRGGAPGGGGVSNNGYAFGAGGLGDNDSGMYSSANGQIEFYSNAIEAMRIASGGNVGIGVTTPHVKLEVGGEITCTAINVTSDRDAKTGFATVEPRAVLEKVVSLPITEWQYKNQPDARHIGPMAQDFHAAFSVGRDGRHITSVDADGVALAAIQGLNQKLEDRIQEKESRIRELESSVGELRELVKQLAGSRTRRVE